MKKVKIKQLNDGVKFPVEVDACETKGGYGVSTSEFKRVWSIGYVSASSSWCFTSEECKEVSK